MGWIYDRTRYCPWVWVDEAGIEAQAPVARRENFVPVIPLPQHDDGVRIERAADGRVYVNAEIDGVPFTALADNGANTVRIGHDLARALGIQWNSSDFNTDISGSLGQMRGVTFTLPLLTVEGVLQGRNLDATIPEVDRGTHIIGKQFWDQFDVLFEKGTGAMIVRH